MADLSVFILARSFNLIRYKKDIYIKFNTDDLAGIAGDWSAYGDMLKKMFRPSLKS